MSPVGARVLITGARGFVGPHVARVLETRGASVIGLGLEAALESGPFVAWHRADLTDADATRSVIADIRPDQIVHLAGQSSAARSFEDPEGTFAANVRGTWNLLEAVRAAAPRARVLIVGSGECYGPQPTGSRVDEAVPFAPVSPYALSKAAADALAEAWGRESGVEVVRARPFSHTGPGQTPRFAIPAFAQQVAAIEAGRAEPVLRVGNLEVTRDISDVRDVALAYALILERAEPGAVFNVCRGTGVRLDALVRDLVAIARVPIRIEIDPARMRPADVPWLVGDPTALTRATGWQAATGLDQTIADVVGEWRAKASEPDPPD